MTRLSRVLLAIASVLLLGAFLFPLWRIDLIAPQYPEGLGMLIRVNTVSGIKPNDLANINGLNHYIGMKPIEPDAIPELRIMPWIVVGLAAFGLLGAALGARRLLYGWLGGFVTLAVVGLIDFWRWEYDYGHNIDFEHAIIKVPGMTYQPPLIGTKQLLNFTAASWPALGTLCLGVAFALGVAALVVARRRGASVKRASVAMAVAVAACAPPGPQAIADKGKSCDYCRMTISDERFGGQLITRKGKVFAFDAIECLASYYLQNRPAGDSGSLWVADFANPGHWIEASNAVFVRNDAHQSPMGLNLVAFSADADKAATGQIQGSILRWQQVLALVQRQRDSGSAVRTAQGDVIVSPSGPIRTLTQGLQAATSGARVVVKAGVYREPTIMVNRPVIIVGEPGAVLESDQGRQILTVQADDVTVRGLELRHVATSFVDDRAAIRVQDATNCVIENNTIEDGFFGIYLARVDRCRVAGNRLHASKAKESASGNGIHLWTSNHITVDGNEITGHRDGIYLEFVHESDVRDNISEGNLRYGMHFMYSDDCRYVANTFRQNGSGVAVMYTKRIEMTDNRFEDNWGAASYGLLLKEILEPALRGNHFTRNTVGLLVDGATRLHADSNDFVDNGWGVRLLASAQDGAFTANEFVGNTFDVATNSRESTTTFAGNYWEDYRGYDLNRDGVGDVPYHPVRLFSLLVAQNEPVLIALRSPFVALLDVAERVLPSLTPEMLADASPAMRRLR